MNLHHIPPHNPVEALDVLDEEFDTLGFTCPSAACHSDTLADDPALAAAELEGVYSLIMQDSD